MRRIRSTSPPKSACPGVSTMLILCSRHRTDVFFDRIVMPRSRSSGFESITRSSTTWLSRNAPACRSILSTSVVLPWSTCAMMATFLIMSSMMSVSDGPNIETLMCESELPSACLKPCSRGTSARMKLTTSRSTSGSKPSFTVRAQVV
jgi:hypothetical protein